MTILSKIISDLKSPTIPRTFYPLFLYSVYHHVCLNTCLFFFTYNSAWHKVLNKHLLNGLKEQRPA